MLAQSPLFFAAPSPLLAAGTMLLLVLVIAFTRRIAIAPTAALLMISGLILLTLSAGEPRLRRASVGAVTVMVDLSPSTRGAAYRDRAALDRRIRRPLRDT